MGLNKFFHAFQPKDKVFYKLFDEEADNLVAIATLFQTTIKNEEQITETFLEKVKELEHKNDECTHKIYQSLSKIFITPFDREDINKLASDLDDIADYIYASTEYLVIYETPYQKEYREFSTIIVACCLEIKKAINELRGFKNLAEVKEACIKINALENKADRLFSNSMKKLFKTKDAVNIMKISTVLENMEEVINRTETVANTIQNIAIKYS